MAQPFPVTKVSQSTLFHFFNLARAARSGLDKARVCKALSIVQSRKATLYPDGTALVEGSKPGQVYTVTADGCSCPDAKYRGTSWCKHRVARGLLLRSTQTN